MKSLKEWCIENNKQEILKLYENGNNQHKSDEVGFSSSKEVKFKCNKCGLSWNQRINKISRKKVIGCPYCLHERASYFYNLAIEYPIVLKEWD